MEKLAECPRRLGDARRKTHRGREGGRRGGAVERELSTPARSIHPRNVFAPSPFVTLHFALFIPFQAELIRSQKPDFPSSLRFERWRKMQLDGRAKVKREGVVSA